MKALYPLVALKREDDELQRFLRVHAKELSEHEPGVRLGSDPQELHKQRVAARRLRALLRSTRSQLQNPVRGERLVKELRWLGGVLGEVRDRDVLIAYLLGELETVEEAAAFGAVLELLDAERQEARTQLLAALDSDRYRDLLADLERPPALAEGERLASAPVIEYRRLRKRAEKLGRSPSDSDLHRVRIAIKRARYAAEAVGGENAFVRRAKEAQDLLGEHQDAAIAEQRIRELVGEVRGTGRTALAGGQLIERQRARRVATRAAWPKTWKRLRQAGDDAWRRG